MVRKKAIWIVALLLLSAGAWAHNDSVKTAKPAIYQGMMLKLDLGAAALELGKSKGEIQDYEIAMNWRLKNKWYPTLEAGYAQGRTHKGDSLGYLGRGGFFRVGLDINPLKKHPELPHALLIGLRLGTSVQQCDQRVRTYMPEPGLASLVGPQVKTVADCWGEIVGGCEVQIAKDKRTHVYGGFYMGWMGRFRCLFTRKDGATAAEMQPIYIPGFGNRDIIAWSLSYHVGYRF